MPETVHGIVTGVLRPSINDDIHVCVVGSIVNIRKFNISGTLPKTSANISKSLEVMTSIILIRITDIHGSRDKNKLFFLNTMHKVKA